MHGTTPRTKQTVATACPLADAGGMQSGAPAMPPIMVLEGLHPHMLQQEVLKVGGSDHEDQLFIRSLRLRLYKKGVYIAQLHLGIVTIYRTTLLRSEWS